MPGTMRVENVKVPLSIVSHSVEILFSLFPILFSCPFQLFGFVRAEKFTKLRFVSLGFIRFEWMQLHANASFYYAGEMLALRLLTRNLESQIEKFRPNKIRIFDEIFFLT